MNMKKIISQKFNYNEILENQILKVQNEADKFNIFHGCWGNNYSLVLINKRFDPEGYKILKAGALRQLNIANLNLEAFCRLCIKDIGEDYDCKELSEVCLIWKKHIQAGNSFLTFKYAEFIIESLTQINYPFIEKINSGKFNKIIHSFLSLDYKYKGFIRIGFCNSFNTLYTSLNDFFSILAANPHLYYYIERIEIAKEDFPSAIESDSNIHYPILRIILDNNIILSKYNPVIDEIRELIPESFHLNKKEIIKMSKPFSTNYKDVGIITQGYNNYKKFLKLLGILDEVYDYNFNYSFIK